MGFLFDKVFSAPIFEGIPDFSSEPIFEDVPALALFLPRASAGIVVALRYVPLIQETRELKLKV